jgi:hypothetical protein
VQSCLPKLRLQLQISWISWWNPFLWRRHCFFSRDLSLSEDCGRFWGSFWSFLLLLLLLIISFLFFMSPPFQAFLPGPQLKYLICYSSLNGLFVTEWCCQICFYFWLRWNGIHDDDEQIIGMLLLLFLYSNIYLPPKKCKCEFEIEHNPSKTHNKRKLPLSFLSTIVLIRNHTQNLAFFLCVIFHILIVPNWKSDRSLRRIMRSSCNTPTTKYYKVAVHASLL